MPSYKCKDIGMQCGYEVKADSEEELMKNIAGHAERAHGMKEIPPEVMEKVKKAIKK